MNVVLSQYIRKLIPFQWKKRHFDKFWEALLNRRDVNWISGLCLFSQLFAYGDYDCNDDKNDDDDDDDDDDGDDGDDGNSGTIQWMWIEFPGCVCSANCLLIPNIQTIGGGRGIIISLFSFHSLRQPSELPFRNTFRNVFCNLDK